MADAKAHVPRWDVFSTPYRVPGVFKNSNGVFEIEIKHKDRTDILVQVETLQKTHLSDEHGNKILLLPPGDLIEVRQFSVKTINDIVRCVAPAVNAAKQGFLNLFEMKQQLVEINEETHEFGVLKLYPSLNAHSNKQPELEWNLNCIRMYDIEKERSLKFEYTSNGETIEKEIKFPTIEHKQAVWFMMSRNRELDGTERIARIVGKYQSIAKIDELYHRLVLNRATPKNRARYRNAPYDKKLYRIDLFLTIVQQQSLADFLLKLEKETVTATEICFLRGALIEGDALWVNEFVQEGGVDKLILATSQSKRTKDVWQLYVSTLECLEAIMNTSKDDFPEVRISGLEHILLNRNALVFVIEQFDHEATFVRRKVMQVLETLLFFSIQNDLDEGLENINKFLTEFAAGKKKASLWYILKAEVEKETRNLQDMLDQENGVEELEGLLDLEYCSAIIGFGDLLFESYSSLQDKVNNLNAEGQSGFQDAISDLVSWVDQLAEGADQSRRKDISYFRDKLENYEATRREIERQVMYGQVNFSDTRAMFEFLEKTCKKQGRTDNLANVLKCLLSIPNGSPNVWEAMVNAMSTILKQITDPIYGDDLAFEQYHSYDHLMNMLKRANGEVPDVQIPKAKANDGAAAKPTLAPELQKYAKMLKMGIPRHVVVQKIILAKLDRNRITEIEAYLKALEGGGSGSTKGPEPTIAPELKKFAKLVQMGVPLSTVKQKMILAKVDRNRLQEVLDYVEAMKKYQAGGSASAAQEPEKPKELAPELKKYMKMLNMGIPKNSILNKMRSEGLDPKRFAEIEDFIGTGSEKKKAVDSKPKKAPDVLTPLWKEIKSMKVDVDDSEIKRLFAEPKPKEVVEKKEKPKEKKVKPKLKCIVLNPKKMNDLNYVIPKLERKGLSYTKIKQALWALDNKMLPMDALSTLVNVLPTADDFDSTWSGDIKTLDPPSRLFFSLKNIPNLTTRANLWIDAECFDDRFGLIGGTVESLLECTLMCRECKSWKKFLGILLRIFKQSNVKADWDKGFQLRYLDTADRKKLADGRSFLHYALDLSKERMPEALEWLEDFQCLENSKRHFKVDDLKNTVSNLNTTFNRLKGAVKGYQNMKIKPEVGCHDGFVTHINPVIEANSARMQKLNDQFFKLREEVKKIAVEYKMLPEIEGKLNTKFLSLLNEFRRKTQALKKKLEAKEEKIRLREMRLRAKAEQKKKRMERKRKKKMEELEKERVREVRSDPARAKVKRRSGGRTTKRRISDQEDFPISPGEIPANLTINTDQLIQKRHTKTQVSVLKSPERGNDANLKEPSFMIMLRNDKGVRLELELEAEPIEPEPVNKRAPKPSLLNQMKQASILKARIRRQSRQTDAGGGWFTSRRKGLPKRPKRADPKPSSSGLPRPSGKKVSSQDADEIRQFFTSLGEEFVGYSEVCLQKKCTMKKLGKLAEGNREFFNTTLVRWQIANSHHQSVIYDSLRNRFNLNSEKGTSEPHSPGKHMLKTRALPPPNRPPPTIKRAASAQVYKEKRRSAGGADLPEFETPISPSSPLPPSRPAYRRAKSANRPAPAPPPRNPGLLKKLDGKVLPPELLRKTSPATTSPKLQNVNSW